MNLHRLESAPSAELAQTLAEFERRFTYPLGPGRTFRICHGDDYPRFFRAIGRAAAFVAESDERVQGVLGMAVRPLVLPDGSARSVAYLGDLKLAPEARGGVVLRRLAREAETWLRPQADSAYAVVMDGTSRVPENYSGRAGIPAFHALGKVRVWRLIHNGEAWQEADDAFLASQNAVDNCFRGLSRGRYANLGGTPAERSEIAPAWLLHPGGQACGRLEDTRRAKRLIADDGSELRSAHLSCFAHRSPVAGAELLRVALRRAGRLGFPALFVAVAPSDEPALGNALCAIEVVIAPATVYGTGLDPGFDWNIHTSEI